MVIYRYKKPNNFWNKEKCRQEAIKYKTSEAFRLGSSGAYFFAYRNGFLVEISEHFTNNRRGYLTKEFCRKEALKYKTKRSFRLKSKKAYSAAIQKGWLKEITGHFVPSEPTWCEEKVLKKAKQHSSATNFRKHSNAAYQAAITLGLLDKVKQLFPNPKVKPRGYWTKERLYEEARKYKTGCEFSKNNRSAYMSTRRKGLLYEFFPK